MRTLLTTAAALCLAAAGTARAADKAEAKGDKVEYDVHNGYLERMDYYLAFRTADKTGLGVNWYAAFPDQDAFDKAFAVDEGKKIDLNKVMPNPQEKGKKNPLPKDVFDKKLVVATAMHGSQGATYKVEKVTTDGDTLYVQYKSSSTFAGNNAVFASPLIVSVDKGKYTSVVFIENGLKSGTADIPKEKDKDKDKDK